MIGSGDFRVRALGALLLLLATTTTMAAPRIVSLAPHLTELAYAAGIGERLAGVVEWSDYPEPARALPRIGDAFRFDLERILRLGATDALAWQGGTPADAINALRELGVEVHVISIQKLDDVADAIAQLGRIGGVDASAPADAWRDRLEALRADHEPATPATAVPVFYQVSARPLFTLGGQHVINEVLSLCGARNVFADLNSAAASVDLEALLARDPLVLLAGIDDTGFASDRTEQEPDIPGDWPSRLPELRAVRCGHLRAVDPDLLVRPGPRLLDGAEALCGWIDTRVRQAAEQRCRP